MSNTEFVNNLFGLNAGFSFGDRFRADKPAGSTLLPTQNNHVVPTATWNNLEVAKILGQLTDANGKPLIDPRSFSFNGLQLPIDPELR